MSDAKMLFVPRDAVLELLKQAFEEGWSGYQDLKEVTAERLLEDFLEERKKNAIESRSVPIELRMVRIETPIESLPAEPAPETIPYFRNTSYVPGIEPAFTTQDSQPTYARNTYGLVNETPRASNEPLTGEQLSNIPHAQNYTDQVLRSPAIGVRNNSTNDWITESQPRASHDMQ